MTQEEAQKRWGDEPEILVKTMYPNGNTFRVKVKYWQFKIMWYVIAEDKEEYLERP
jgi:hypothetical protein